MKKTFKLVTVFLLVTLSLVSCSKDDDGPSTSGNIVGKWEFFKEGERINGNEELFLYEHQAGCTKDNVEFKADGTFVNTDYFSTNCISDEAEGTYTKNGNTIIASSDGESDILTIKQLDQTTLKIYIKYSEDGENFTAIEIYKRAN